MRRRNQISTGEMKALAQEEKERQERLESKGLCFHCEENPQNPHLSGKVCLECWESERYMGCHTSGCPNSADGSFRQAQFCKVHLSNIAHGQYEQYLELKSEIQDREQELEDRAGSLEHDPREGSTRPSDMSSAQQEFMDDWIQFKYERQELGRLKAEIESIMDSIDNAFHDNFEVFG